MGMHMGHVALRVSDLDAYIDHIQAALGLQLLERSDDSAYLGSQGTRHELQLIAADEPAFDHVGLMVETEAQFDATVQQALDAGGTLLEEGEERGCVRAATILGPAGIAYQLYIPEARPPLTLATKMSSAIRRLGHLTFFSNEITALTTFWCDGLGFRVSDVQGGFVWTRCDSWHHTLAVGTHPAETLLHHHAWETQDINSLAKYCDLNGLAGRPQMWGPVRHGPGFNLATYMPDASGALIEVYTDLLVIEDDVNYVPMDWTNEPLALNLWGTMPSPDVLAAGVPLLERVAA